MRYRIGSLDYGGGSSLRGFHKEAIAVSNQEYKFYFLDGPRRGTSITVDKPRSWLEVPVEPKLDLCKYVGQSERVELSKPEFIRYSARNLGGALFGVCETSDEQFMLLVRNAMLGYLGLLQKQPPPLDSRFCYPRRSRTVRARRGANMARDRGRRRESGFGSGGGVLRW